MVERTLSDQVLNPPFTQPDPTSVAGAAVNSVFNTGRADTRRPSDAWLRNPAWMGTQFMKFLYAILLIFGGADGGLDPPGLYYTHEEIEATCRAHGVVPPPRYASQDPALNQIAPVNDLAMARPGLHSFFSFFE